MGLLDRERPRAGVGWACTSQPPPWRVRYTEHRGRSRQRAQAPARHRRPGGLRHKRNDASHLQHRHRVTSERVSRAQRPRCHCAPSDRQRAMSTGGQNSASGSRFSIGSRRARRSTRGVALGQPTTGSDGGSLELKRLGHPVRLARERRGLWRSTVPSRASVGRERGRDPQHFTGSGRKPSSGETAHSAWSKDLARDGADRTSRTPPSTSDRLGVCGHQRPGQLRAGRWPRLRSLRDQLPEHGVHPPHSPPPKAKHSPPSKAKLATRHRPERSN